MREENLRTSERSSVMEAMLNAERKDKPDPMSMFDDVYQEIPVHLQRQKEEMVNHTKKYPSHYTMDDH